MTCEVKVKIGELEIQCSGDEDQIEAHLERTLRVLRKHLPSAVFGENGAETNGQPSGPTVADLLSRSRARSYGDKAIIVAYWLQEHGGRQRWRTGDIVEQLEEAGESTPSNMTDALNYKAKKGLFKVEDRLWELTEKGRGWYESLTDDRDESPD